MDKYSYLIELSKDLPIINNEARKDENLINGCQSKVWLDAKFTDGKISFFGDSDAIITKGIIALLIAIYIPWFNKLLGTVPLNFSTWAIILGTGIFSLILIEIIKAYYLSQKSSS